MELNSENEDNKRNFFTFFRIYSYKFSLLCLINLFNISIIFLIFILNFMVFSCLKDDLNENDFYKNIIEPISNEYENLTQEISIRLRAQDDIFMESKQENLRIVTEFILQQKESYIPDTANIELKTKFSEIQTNNNLFSNKIKAIFRKYMDIINKNENNPIKFDQIFLSIKDSSDGMNIEYYLSSCEICINHIDFIYKYISQNSYLKNWENDNDKTILSYFNNSNNEYLDIASKQNLSIKFYDKIVKNIFANDYYTNYIKFLKFKTTYKDKIKDVMIGMKFNNTELVRLLNRANRNLTVIYQREKEKDYDSDDFAIILGQDYLEYFYEYSFSYNRGLIEKIKNDNISIPLKEVLKMHTWNSSSVTYIINTTLSNLINISYNPSLTKEFFTTNDAAFLFNSHFLKEVLFLGLFITSTIRKNYNETFGNEFVNKTSVFDSSMNNVPFCRVQNIENSEFIKIEFCEYLKKNNAIGLYYPFKNINSSYSFVKEIKDSNKDKYTKEIYFLKYFNKIEYIYKIFLGNEDEDNINNNIANKSFWIYVSYINGLKTVFLDMINFENYVNLLIQFREKIESNFDLLMILMLIIGSIGILLIFYLSFSFVEFSQKKLESFNVLKSNLFFNELSINYLNNTNLFLETPIEPQIIQFIGDCNEKNIRKSDIIKLKDTDIDFLKINIYLSVKYRRKLKNVIKCVIQSDIKNFSDNWLNNEKKIKLMFQNGIIEEENLQEYTAFIREMNKLSMTKMDDVGYNFNYSPQYFQENNFILYKMINHAHEGKTLSNERSGFFKSDEIIKIIYHIKKNIIQNSLRLIKSDDFIESGMHKYDKPNTLIV